MDVEYSILKMENKLRVFKNRVMRKIFGSKTRGDERVMEETALYGASQFSLHTNIFLER